MKYSEYYPRYLYREPLIIAGHVGFQFEPPTFFGFHPPQWAIEQEGGIENVLTKLSHHEELSGTIQDDTEVFHLAYELSLNRSREIQAEDRLHVYYMDVAVEDAVFDTAYETCQDWYNQEYVRAYSWPPISEQSTYDNCSTVQRHLHIPIPYFESHRGQMRLYITVFQRFGKLWTPET